jgi:hypothetical protein
MFNVCQIFYTITLDTLDTMVYTLDVLDTYIEQQSIEVTVARSMTEKLLGVQGVHTASSSFQDESTCTRCGGLMVNDFCMDLLNSSGESKFSVKRCVQCGEVVDSVILLNRQLGQEPMTVQLARKMVPNNCVMKGR